MLIIVLQLMRVIIILRSIDHYLFPFFFVEILNVLEDIT